MKITSESEALLLVGKEDFYIPKLCPYHAKMSNRSPCGSWCPHFFIDEMENTIYITCSGTRINLGVIE